MRAGDLRRRVRVQTRATSQDSFGQQVTTWSDLLSSVPADIQPMTGRELIAAQATNTEITHQIELRYHTALSNPVAVAAMRVLYGSRVFEIRASMNVDERNRQITLLASEGANQG